MSHTVHIRYNNLVAVSLVVGCVSLVTAAAVSAESMNNGNNWIQACPATPNCVSSNPGTDADHRVPPLRIDGSPQAAWDALKKVLESQERMLIAKDADAYIHAESTSLIFGFVDDVEFQLDAGKGVIHLRSASRVGYWDFGVNRRRVEALREQLSKRGVAH